MTVPAPVAPAKPNVWKRLLAAVTSKEARGPELALARLVLAALGVKLGVNLVDYLN